MDLPKLILIDEECGNLKVVVDGGQFTTNITERGSQKFYKPIDVHSVTIAIYETDVSLVFLAVAFFVGGQ